MKAKISTNIVAMIIIATTSLMAVDPSPSFEIAN